MDGKRAGAGGSFGELTDKLLDDMTPERLHEAQERTDMARSRLVERGAEVNDLAIFQEFTRKLLVEIAPCPIQMILPIRGGPYWSPWPQRSAPGWWAEVTEERREEYMLKMIPMIERNIAKETEKFLDKRDEA